MIYILPKNKAETVNRTEYVDARWDDNRYQKTRHEWPNDCVESICRVKIDGRIVWTWVRFIKGESTYVVYIP